MALRARPLHDRIVIKAEGVNDVTEGGIHIVSFAEKPKRCGEVLAVGPGVMSPRGVLIPTTLKPGDRVVFGSYAGTEIIVDGEKLRIMREGDVACIVDPDAEVETDGLPTRRTGTASQYQ